MENGNFNCRYRKKIIVVDHMTIVYSFSSRNQCCNYAKYKQISRSMEALWEKTFSRR